MYRILARGAWYAGEGWVGGCLYDLGEYPGMALSDRATDRVVGEVYELHAETAEASLVTLDDYEGLGPEDALPPEYSRQIVTVNMQTGGSIDAWAYVLTRSTQGLTRIESGDYLSWVRSRRGA